MQRRSQMLNRFAGAALAALLVLPLSADEAPQPELDEAEALLTELADPEQERWQRLERQIQRLWSRSGSASADLLLQRGREALRTGDTAAAIEHLTALTDHAPDFAEGWHARATAYFMADQYGPAMADIQRTLALNPRHYAALSGLGVIFEDLGIHDRALDAYRAAQAIHPHRPDITSAVERLELKLDGTPL